MKTLHLVRPASTALAITSLVGALATAGCSADDGTSSNDGAGTLPGTGAAPGAGAAPGTGASGGVGAAPATGASSGSGATGNGLTGGTGGMTGGTGGTTGGTGGGTGGATGGTGGGTSLPPAWTCDDCPEPPATLTDWINGHGETMHLLGYDGHVAVYADSNVDTDAASWVQQFTSDAVAYIKQHYDPECHYGNARLHVFLHQGSHGGGTISSYFDAFSSFRNAIDGGVDDWTRSPQNLNIDILSHELAHIVEGSSNCIHESPGFGVWGDSKWAEIFQYDLYAGLGMEDDAQKMYDRFTNGGDPWFPKFYWPMYRDYGGVEVLDAFFKLLAEHFPTHPENDGANETFGVNRANLGELVHFYSGAAGADVSNLAIDAFGSEFLPELEQAKIDFPGVTY